MKKYNYFRTSEFTKSLSTDEIEEVNNSSTLQANLEELRSRLNMIRYLFGSAIIINSWYRDSKHNARVGGSATSQHLEGEAVDITSKNNAALFQTIQSVMKNGMDFGQVITYGSNPIRFIHLSLPTRKDLNKFLHYV